MEKFKVSCMKKNYEVEPLLTVEEFIFKHEIKVNDPVAVVINGVLARLNAKIRTDSALDVIDLESQLGKRIYESSVTYLFVVAFTKLYPKLNVFIQHSIQKGVYAEIDGAELSVEEIEKIAEKMKQMVEADMEINQVTRDWDVSMSTMKEKERNDMLNLYRYYSPSSFKFYELDGVEESVYLPLLPSTKHLKYFHIQKYRDGVVIILPEFIGGSKDIPVFEDRPRLFKTFQEYNEWTRILKVRTVGQLNKYIMNGQIDDLIKVAEAFHEKRVANIADQITKGEKPKRLVLIAGPTSSGKTTFSKRLGIQLMVNGFNTVPISMDNYFVDRAHTPKDAEGNFDFESLDAIDVPLFMEHINRLLLGEEVEIPRFDFHTGSKRPSGYKLKLSKNEIVVIEGIHGINPKLTSSVSSDDKFKIYIAPLTQLNLHRHDRIPASDTRLIRRIVRDSFFRGYTASETIGRWRSVRAGEKKNIFPLQEEVDTVYNSALFYELSVLKVHAERELLRVERGDPVYPESQRLLKFLSYFLPLDAADIPSTSIIKEFIGGSSFKY